jgi:ABC-type Fe3+ transport system, permease component
MNRFQVTVDELKKILRDPILVTTIIFVMIALILFILWPLYAVLHGSFISESGNFTLKYLIDALSSQRNLKILWQTLLLGVIVSTFATAIGFLFAYTDAFIRFPCKKIFGAIALMPIVSPPFALAMSFVMLFGQQGFVTKTLLGLKEFNAYGATSLGIVQVLTFFPIAYLLLAGLLRQIDPAYEEAAKNLGASRWQVFRTVILPLLLPGIANSFLLIFIQVVADFGNAMVIAGDFTTLAAQVYMQAIGNYDIKGGFSLASVLLTISIIMFIIQKYWLAGRSFVTVTGKPSRVRDLQADRLIQLSIGIPCLLVSLFVIILYGLIPYGSLVKLWGIDYTFTFDHYLFIFDGGLKPLIDTTILSLIAMPITGILGIIIAFLIVRKKFPGRGFIEFTSMLSLAIPGTVIGLGYLYAYNDQPLALTGTGFIILIAFIFRSMPVGIRAGVASLQQIDPAIEEAAQDMGAGSIKVFTSVILPLIKSAFFSGLVYSFVRSMTAISAVIFLTSARYDLLTTAIYSRVDMGRYGVAAAYSTLLIIIVLLVSEILKYLMRRIGADFSENHGG